MSGASRKFVTFDCEGSQIAATLDLPPSPPRSALLVVTGGNEVRAGAWNGHAQLAARLAEAGHAVLRFDRRGVGDSEGGNAGFRGAAPDIAAALACLRREAPELQRVVGWGNCDAASALMLTQGQGFSGLVLSNPWTYEQDTDDAEETDADVVGSGDVTPAMTSTELRAHYRARLFNLDAVKRLLTGRVPVRSLVRSVIGMLRKPPPPSSLAQDMARGLSAYSGPALLLVAEGDRTGQAFLGSWDRADPRLRICPKASHSFVEPHAREWLDAQLLDALNG
jgi:exosortase A-associated hydrolase 1